MMRHVSISPRCFCCIGWHDAESALCWSGRREAPPLRCFFAFAFAARMQWSGRGRAERRGARQEQSSNDEAMSTCLGQTWQCDVRERPARRAAAPPLLLF